MKKAEKKRASVESIEAKKPKRVSFINLKGGVGKTASSVNFAAYCGANGFKTLLIDIDPQTNATFACIKPQVWDSHASNNGTVADLLGLKQHNSGEGRDKPVRKVIIKDVFKNVDLLPSHLELFTVDLDLAGKTAREVKLKRALSTVENDYDFVVVDCPPNLAIATQNAIAYSDYYVVPVSPDFLSAIGVALLISRVNELCDDLDHKITNAGILLTRIGRPSSHRQQMMDDIGQRFKEAVFEAKIKERDVVSRAAAENKSIFEMEDQDAKMEFTAFCDQLLARLRESK